MESTWSGAPQRLFRRNILDQYHRIEDRKSTNWWAKPVKRSKCVASLDIIVVICPTLCSLRPRPDSLKDFRKIFPTIFNLLRWCFEPWYLILAHPSADVYTSRHRHWIKNIMKGTTSVLTNLLNIKWFDILGLLIWLNNDTYKIWPTTLADSIEQVWYRREGMTRYTNLAW